MRHWPAVRVHARQAARRSSPEQIAPASAGSRIARTGKPRQPGRPGILRRLRARTDHTSHSSSATCLSAVERQRQPVLSRIRSRCEPTVRALMYSWAAARIRPSACRALRSRSCRRRLVFRLAFAIALPVLPVKQQPFWRKRRSSPVIAACPPHLRHHGALPRPSSGTVMCSGRVRSFACSWSVICRSRFLPSLVLMILSCSLRIASSSISGRGGQPGR